MNELMKLRAKARAIITAYKPGDDFDALVASLAAVGHAIEDALGDI